MPSAAPSRQPSVIPTAPGEHEDPSNQHAPASSQHDAEASPDDEKSMNKSTSKAVDAGDRQLADEFYYDTADIGNVNVSSKQMDKSNLSLL
ncbi:hypothetical protein HK102_012563 [Quaeritorhiza haematococci]|nr:hypothetical protein HK102_012563 [Quaeritorhiza haematococci]